MLDDAEGCVKMQKPIRQMGKAYRVTPFYTSEAKLNFSRKLRANPTYAEQLLWNRLKSRQRKGNTFIRQRVILGWIVDFYCAARKLVIEVDGPTHNKERDKVRDSAMNKIGLFVLRITNDDVIHQMQSVLDRIDGLLIQV